MSERVVAGLQFRCKELVEETEALRDMAAGLLAPDGDRVLADLVGQMNRACQRATQRPVEIQLSPLRTRPTLGYEPGSRSGGTEIYACVTGVWEVRSLGGTGPKSRLAFTGKASTVIELWPAECLAREREKGASRLAMWRIELGAHDAPGCYFHFQVLGDRADPPFPKSIPIPRLPSPFVTPMAAVEFVLGELFQDEWPRKASEARHHQRRWRAIQRQRWCSLLRWQQRALDVGGSSPWMNLKAAKPPDDLFVN